LLLVILSTSTERFFLMYGNKITIILCFLSLIRFFCSSPVPISQDSINYDDFALFPSFLGEHVFHHVTGQQKVIVCCEKSVHVSLGCFQVFFVNLTCPDL
jgi:acetone carboxylase gamma subunit